jgi:L-histidine N-alpha-methyltransferase
MALRSEESGVHVAVEDRDARSDFAQAVLSGLAQKRKSIPCRFFYDAEGSALFEEITELPEYYPTRTETALLELHAEDIAAHAGPGRVLVEFGSGSSRKTRLLLDALRDLAAYVPIDVSRSFLAEAAERLRADHEGLPILPLVGDFMRTRDLPRQVRELPKLGFFSGSTIGNLSHTEAAAFLANAKRLLGRYGLFLVAVDLKKDLDILLPAYDDAAGVTASFNLNLLARINRELEGDFDLSCFAHEATYNRQQGRVEIHIVSLAGQDVSVRGRRYSFAKGERVHTENSHKYTVAEFQNLARAAGWAAKAVWTDKADLFSLHLLAAD